MKYSDITYIHFPVWLQNRFKSDGLEPVFSHTEKSCIASNYRKFFTNIKIKITKLIPVLLVQASKSSGIKERF